MKPIKILSLAFLVAGMSASCSGQANEQNKLASVKKADDIQVYYFHYSRGCATCKAVESESKIALHELYGDKVGFLAYKLDEAEGKEKADELGVSSQTL